MARSKCAQAAEQASHVDGLPSGQRRGVGQCPGELLAVARAQGVPQAGFDVADVGFQLARDGGRAEAAVQEPDVVGLALEDADDGAVDAAGRGDLPEQFGVLAGAGRCGAAWLRAGRELAGREAKEDAGVVGHAEAVGDALEDRSAADLPGCRG